MEYLVERVRGLEGQETLLEGGIVEAESAIQAIEASLPGNHPALDWEYTDDEPVPFGAGVGTMARLSNPAVEAGHVDEFRAFPD